MFLERLYWVCFLAFYFSCLAALLVLILLPMTKTQNLKTVFLSVVFLVAVSGSICWNIGARLDQHRAAERMARKAKVAERIPMERVLESLDPEH